MKRTIGLMALLAVEAVNAQSNAFYKELYYRRNDPFLFCTRGMDIPDPCWVPMAPFTGQYMLTGICDPPNQYGRSWTQDDTFALKQLEEICPQAQQSGTWDSKGGDAASTPFTH